MGQGNLESTDRSYQNQAQPSHNLPAGVYHVDQKPIGQQIQVVPNQIQTEYQGIQRPIGHQNKTLPNFTRPRTARLNHESHMPVDQVLMEYTEQSDQVQQGTIRMYSI